MNALLPFMDNIWMIGSNPIIELLLLCIWIWWMVYWQVALKICDFFYMNNVSTLSTKWGRKNVIVYKFSTYLIYILNLFAHVIENSYTLIYLYICCDWVWWVLHIGSIHTCVIEWRIEWRVFFGGQFKCRAGDLDVW